MNNLQIDSNPKVQAVFDNYPDEVRDKLLELRRIIIEAANEVETNDVGSIGRLEETLKWGEPSYLAKHGSTIRFDWKQKTPGQYAIYFKCTSKLVSTFKTVYEDLFHFEGTRAIVFQLNEEIPEAELKNCIRAGLTYHKVKELPQLGL